MLLWWGEGEGRELQRGSIAGERQETFLPQPSHNDPLPFAHSLGDLWQSVKDIREKGKKKGM